MKKLRKGFTIVELVIVIAVIAIIAAILIPTFVHLSKKAKVASDQSLVTNLNTALKIEEAESGKKPQTMHEAVEGLVNQGYYLPQFVTKSEEELVYNIEANQFYLSSSVEAGKEANYWHIEKSMPSTQKWAIYAFNWEGTSAGTSEKPLTVGFDAGSEKGITDINFGGGRDAIIRTNSALTNLTINAPTNVVHHYGTAGNVVIKAIASSSYHENGTVAFLEVANGRVALEKDSDVTQIHLTATEGNFNNITIAKESSVEMPEFSRDPVDIPAEGKVVVALQEGTSNADAEKDYVWLTAIGIYEQVTVSSSSSNPGNEYAATSTDVSDEQKETAQQIANNITFTSNDVDYVVTATTSDGGATWEYAVTTESGATTEFTATESAGVVTVVDGETPVETTVNNGLTQDEKEEIKTTIIDEAKAPEVADEYEDLNGAVVYNLTTSIYYEDLYAAINGVPENTKQTIVLLKNVSNTSNKNYEIPANKTVVLDLNGKVLSTVAPDASVAYTIVNKGNLTIKDNTDKAKDGSGKGKIVSRATQADPRDIPGYASNTITNNGKLIVESGLIENKSSNYGCFPIDNQTNGDLYTPELVINGGKLLQEAQYVYALRMFCNSTTKVNKTVINGGIIEGGYAFWMQTPNNNANKADLVINGGTFIAHDGYALYFGGSGSTLAGRNFSNTSIVFNGGILNRVMVGGVSAIERAPATFDINGGRITELALGDNILEAKQYVIHENGDGTYTIAPAKFKVVYEQDVYVAASLSDETIYVDMYGFWGMNATGCVDSEGNQCPQYILSTDETLYRDVAVTEGQPEDYVSAKYLFDNYIAAGKKYEGKHIYKIDGTTSATVLFETEAEADAFVATNGGTKFPL